MKSELVLENPRALVERLVIERGEATSMSREPDDRLWVFVKGGVLTSRAGRSTWWRDGRVLWQGGGDCREDGLNTGSAAIEMICVKLRPWAPGPAPHAYVDYPNVPGEDLFENARVIVQRFTVPPGQWEGTHAHEPDTLYIHIKGGQWAVRSRREGEYIYPDPSPDGEVGWMEAIDLSEGHESGNVGPEPIDLIWVSFKA